MWYLLGVCLCFASLVNSILVKQNDSAVAELEVYIQSKIPTLNQRFRQQYHVMGAVGWINDPNGFSFYKGEYHLFYQFYPYASLNTGPIHWGHVSSTDLVYWKQLPTALLPDEEMCFSGSAVVDGDTMTLMYTGHIITGNNYNESQYLAHSTDGISFKKFAGNPVIAGAPNGSPDFRDPKAWKHDNHWYMVLGSNTDDLRGRILLYRSTDLINWEYLTIMAESQDPKVYMYECPDFFELDGKFVLLFSPQGMEAEGDRYKNVFQNGYIIGSFNYNTFQFIPEVGFQEIDYGHDFYAAQTMENSGKRYLVSWFSMWEQSYPEAADGWAGSMTIVRELSLANNRINMKPVSEMIKLRDTLVSNGTYEANQTVQFNKTAEIMIAGNLSINIELKLEGSDGGGKTWILWNATSKMITVDRGDNDSRRVEWSAAGSQLWRLYLDASSLELFCGDGEVVFSSRVYPEGGWEVTNLSPQDLSIEAYSLKKSFPMSASGAAVVTISNFYFLICSILVVIFHEYKC